MRTAFTPATVMPVRPSTDNTARTQTAPDPEDGDHVTAAVSTPSSEKPVFSLQLHFLFTLQFQCKAFPDLPGMETHRTTVAEQELDCEIPEKLL